MKLSSAECYDNPFVGSLVFFMGTDRRKDGAN
jgi:hypothetical protein